MAARKKSRAAGSRAAKRSSAGAKRKSAGAGRKGAPKKNKAAPRRKAAPKKKAAPRRRAAPKKRAARRGTARPAAALAAPAMPSAIGFRAQHIDYTTHALDEVRRFYTEHLGFTRFEYDQKMSYLMVTTGPSSSLGFMPPMPGPPEDWRPPREPAIYLIVDDVDRAHRDLTAKGVAFEQAPADMPWGHRVALVRDPEGRAVWLAQILGGA